MTTELRRLPIIKLWHRILVPIQGEITDDLAEQLSHEVLRVREDTERAPLGRRCCTGGC